MPVPSAITDLSTTLASNSPAGSDNVFPDLDNYLRAHAQFVALLRDGRGLSTEVSLASAATCDIGGAASMFVQITGTTTITSFGTNYLPRILRFAGVLTLTHNATTLILPTGANITTAAGDMCLAVPVGTSGWRVLQYQRASEGADFVSFLQAGTGAQIRTVQSKLRDVVSVKDFGAVGNGIANDTLAIQAAIDYAETFASGIGCAVYFPQGSYLYSALTIDSGFVHLTANGDARLIKSTNTGDGLTIKSTGSRIYGVKVSGLTFANNSAASSGRQLYVENVGQCSFDHVAVTNFPAAAFQGVEFVNVAQCEVFGLEVQNCASHGVRLSDCLDFYLVGGRSDANTGCGVVLDTVSGLYATNFSCWNNGQEGWNGVQTVASPIAATAGFSFNFFAGCIADSNASHNWFMSNLKQSSFTICWGATQSGTTADRHGFYLNDCDGVVLSGCLVITNNAAGLFIQSNSVGITISGGRFDGNGKQSGSARREGIVIGSGCEVILDGVNCQDTQTVQTQQYGLRVQSGVSKLVITNSDFSGNVIYPYAFDATPSNYFESANFTGEPMTVTSSSTMQLPMFGDVFEITGTTNINAIASQWPKRSVVLIFQGALTVGDTGSLKLNGAFVTTADDTLSLVSNGTNWYETARSAN